MQNYIEMWHPVDGKWTHIVQTDSGDVRMYYTDGLLVMAREINNHDTAEGLPRVNVGRVDADNI